MKYKNLIFTLLIFLALIAVGVTIGLITHDINMQKTELRLYFFNSSQSTIVPEDRIVKYNDFSELPQLAVERLIKGPQSGRFVKMINNGTRLNKIESIDQSTVIVDFSSEYLSEDNTKTLLASYSVIKSLYGINGIERIKVTVDGSDIIKPDGQGLDFLSGDDINLATDTNNGEEREVILYFGDKGSDRLAKETRRIKVRDQQPLEQYIISELIKGPSNSEHTAVLSPSTNILSVKTVDNICFINFDSTFISKNVKTASADNRAVYSVVNALTELDTVARVQFLINGKKIDNFGGINLSDMFGRNTSVIK